MDCVARWFAGLVFTLLSIAARADDPLQAALAASTAPIRSIDAGADTADLEPLIASIGDARIVLLGEPSHGSGGAFSAKVRLIRFLHQRMGFDVVAWESGLHGVDAARAALAGDGDAVAAARLGIFPMWSAAEEVRPLFEYAASTRGSARPLEMAGFDLAFTAPGAAERLATDMHEFLAATDDAALRSQLLALADALFPASDRLHAPPTPPAPAEVRAGDLEAVTRASDALLRLLRERRATLARVHSELRIGFMECALRNLRDDATNVYARRRADRPKDEREGPLLSEEWNRRDTRMAENLRWLIEERYRGRKVIVWAHNAHIVHAHFAANWASMAHEPVPGGMTPMGALLTQMFPGGVYALGFTTFDGEENWVNGQKRGTIAPAPAGSLEARLHALQRPYLFVDLHAVARRLGAPVGPVSMRISGFGPPTWLYGNDVVPDLARAFDGVFFIDRMSPATAIGASAKIP